LDWFSAQLTKKKKISFYAFFPDENNFNKEPNFQFTKMSCHPSQLLSFKNVALIFSAFSLFCLSYAEPLGKFYGTGIAAITGDTFEIDKGDSEYSERVLVKLIGVRAPEENEPYFNQSRTHLNNFVALKFLKVEFYEQVIPDNEDEMEMYIGLVTMLEIGQYHGSYLNALAIATGIAKHDKEESAKYDQEMNQAFESHQNEAQENKRGMWAPDCEKEEVPDLSRTAGFSRFAETVQIGSGKSRNNKKQKKIPKRKQNKSKEQVKTQETGVDQDL